jgi:tetratricopeptide (TPR) repeat protein
MAEEIINVLAHIENFKVIARTSAFAFKDKQTDIREIGRILNVETLLEGSIRKDGDRLRITAQLIKVADGSHIWSERYDREIKDVFAIQDEIALAIADNLKVKLIGDKTQIIAKRHSENIEAYKLYLRGIYFYQMMTQEGFRKASEYFEQAFQEDPNYSLAYVGLAAVLINRTVFWNVSPDEAYPKMNEYVNKVLEMDSALAESYWVLANINMYYYWNWKEAERNFIHALQINPNPSIIHIDYSVLLTFTGRHEEAIVESKRAQELDPISPYINTRVGEAFYYAGHLDKAIEKYREILIMSPNYFLAHYQLGICYLLKSMFKESVDEYQKAIDLSYDNPFIIACIVCNYYRLGERDQAIKLTDSLKVRSETEYVPATCFFLIHRVLGEEDQALVWLKKACSEHDTWLPWLRALPFVISKGSKYMALLKERGL